MEMESSVLFAIATLRGYKAGTILLAGGNLFIKDGPRLSAEETRENRKQQHIVALEAIKLMDLNQS